MYVYVHVEKNNFLNCCGIMQFVSGDR